MKKKALIIISIIVVAFIIILLPNNNNNNIEKTTAETNLAEPTPEATPSPTSIPDLTPTPKTETGVTEFNAKQGIIEGYEVTPDTTTETASDELDSANGVEVNSTHTDVQLGEDEYKGDNEANLKESATETVSEEDLDAIADQIYQDLLKEHPEWVADENTTQQGNYEHVGTPDSGELPTYNFGESGQDGIDKSVTVY